MTADSSDPRKHFSLSGACFVTQLGHLLPCYKRITSLDMTDQGWGTVPVYADQCTHMHSQHELEVTHPSLLPEASLQTICEQKGMTMTQLLTHGKLSAIMNYSFRL